MPAAPTASPLVPPPTFQHLSLAGGIRAAMHRAPDKIAYRHRDRTRTYRELLERIDRVTAGLTAGLGLKPGEHGAIVGKNSIEYMEIVLGASQAGVALATVNPRLSLPEIVAICDDAGARVVFADPEAAAALRDARLGDQAGHHRHRPRAARPGWRRPRRRCQPCRSGSGTTSPFPTRPGTTGKPKGVLVPHRSRILTLFGMAVEYGCYAPDDRFLAIAPMCHGAGMIFSLAPVFFGGYAEIIDKFDPDDGAGQAGQPADHGLLRRAHALPRPAVRRRRGAGRQPQRAAEGGDLQCGRPAAGDEGEARRPFRAGTAARDLRLHGGGHRLQPPAAGPVAQAPVRRPAVSLHGGRTAAPGRHRVRSRRGRRAVLPQPLPVQRLLGTARRKRPSHSGTAG